MVAREWFRSYGRKKVYIGLHNNIICIHSNKYELTPEENQSPSGVGVTKDFMASTIDTEVDAAEDLPHFFMRAPPLCILNL